MLLARRGFLGALLAAPAVIAATQLMPVSSRLLRAPKLWLDGAHCDADAIQWMVDNAKGWPVMHPSDHPNRGSVALVTKPVRLGSGDSFHGWNLRGTGPHALELEQGARNVLLNDITLEMSGPKARSAIIMRGSFEFGVTLNGKLIS